VKTSSGVTGYRMDVSVICGSVTEVGSGRLPFRGVAHTRRRHRSQSAVASAVLSADRDWSCRDPPPRLSLSTLVARDY